MKKCITLVMLFLSLVIFSNTTNEIFVNESFIKSTSNQLDILYSINSQKSNSTKWYIVFLGHDEKKIKKRVALNTNDPFEYLGLNTLLNFEEEKLIAINEVLKKINSHADYDMYAFITDSKLKILIPSTVKFKKTIPNLLDELEKNLITASFDTPQEIHSYKDQQKVYSRIKNQIYKGSHKSSLIKNIIDEVYEKTTLFKSSSKKNHVIQYAVFSHLYRTNGVDTILGEQLSVIGTNFSKGNPKEINGSAIRDYLKTFKGKGYDQKILARVEAYKRFLIDENENIVGLKQGIGKRIYINELPKIITEVEKQKLIELANFLTDTYSKQTVTTKYEVITDYESIINNKDRNDVAVLISENNIKSKEGFLELYPYYGIARQYKNGLNEFRVYFSNTNLWTKTGDLESNEVLGDDYNENSIDYYVSDGKELQYPYYYSLVDLKARYKYIATGNTNNFITKELLKIEELGLANSASESEHNRQYNAQFKTNYAYPFIAKTAANWAKGPLAALMAQRLVFEYGAFFVEEVFRNTAAEVLKNTLRKGVEKYGKDALQGALIDFGIQVVFNRIFNDEIKTISEAANPSNINWISVAVSAGENTIKYKNKYLEFASGLSLACLVNGLSDNNGIKEDFDLEGCGYGIAGAILGKGVGVGYSKVSKYLKPLAKYSREQLKKGLKKLDFEEGKADEIIENIKRGEEKAIDDSYTNDGIKIEQVGEITNTIDQIGIESRNIDEVLDELKKTNSVSTNNPVTDLFKKFWSQHEFNVSKYLQKNYGRLNVGRQITLDIYIKDIGKITCRVDNLIKLKNGKFQIVDAKSSVVQNLSQKKADDIASSLTTKNQKVFYEALKNKNIDKIKPRGQRAISYFKQFSEFNNLLPENLNIEESIDFYVNDIAQKGYNIFKITYN